MQAQEAIALLKYIHVSDMISILAAVLHIKTYPDRARPERKGLKAGFFRHCMVSKDSRVQRGPICMRDLE